MGRFGPGVAPPQGRDEEDMKTFKRKTVASLSALALMLLVSGCGGEAYRTVSTDNSPASGGSGGGGSGTPWVDPGTGGSGGGTVITPAIPAYSYDFSVTGEGGTTPTFTSASVDTDNLLVVRVSAKSAGIISATNYSNFSGNYECVQYEVTALGKTLSTGVLSTVPGGATNCPGAPTYADLNFSDRLGAGHNAVNIEIRKVYYDFYCSWAKWVNASWPYSGYDYQNLAYYCPVKTVYRTHTVNGKIQVKVNGTEFSSY